MARDKEAFDIEDPRQRKEASMSRPGPSPAAESVAEVVGTFILVFFGCGSVAVAVLTGALAGLWQVAIVWGFGITLAIYATAAVSGAHINPAVTLAFAIFRRSEFPPSKILRYWVSQFVGAFLAAGLLYVLFSGVLADFESTNDLVRGASGSQLSAMMFGEYFPNPAVFSASRGSFGLVPIGTGLAAEAVGTAFLAFFVFALTDRRNQNGPGAMTPFFIGFTVAIIISIIAPLTQAGLNPARDFGPRLFSFIAGWGEIAIPGPRGGFWIYIAGPLVGAVGGSLIYQTLIGRALPTRNDR
ncbi:MAG: MIP/aquaporin family protein [Terriglobia bacterium]